MRRRPAPPSAQQMIRDYLGQVSSAAQHLLPKGDRLLFVGRTRASIEARVGPLPSADADAVAAALTALGDPEELAKQERERLYTAKHGGGAAPPVALWKPAKDSRRGTRPLPRPPRPRSGDGPPWKPRPWPTRGSAAIPAAPGTGAAPPPDQPSGGPPGAGAAPPGPAMSAGAAPPGPATSAGPASGAQAAPPAGTVPSNGQAHRDGLLPPGGPGQPGRERPGAVTPPARAPGRRPGP